MCMNKAYKDSSIRCIWTYLVIEMEEEGGGARGNGGCI